MLLGGRLVGVAVVSCVVGVSVSVRVYIYIFLHYFYIYIYIYIHIYTDISLYIYICIHGPLSVCLRRGDLGNNARNLNVCSASGCCGALIGTHREGK